MGLLGEFREWEYRNSGVGGRVMSRAGEENEALLGREGGTGSVYPIGFWSKCYAGRPVAVKQLALIRFGTKLAKRPGKAHSLERFRTKSV